MKITDLKTYVVGTPPPHYGGKNWVFVKLTTNDGIEGWGEVTEVPFQPNTVARLMEDMGERFVINANPFNIEKLWRILYASGYGQHPDLTKMAVISSFEIACWDIIGKALNQPVYNLLGGQYHDRLRSYTYLYPVPGDDVDRITVHIDPDWAARSAAAHVKEGFTAVKFDPLRDLMSPFDPRPIALDKFDRAEAVVRSVREAVGSKCDILIGTHGQMTTDSAIRFARRLEKYDPLWFEEPVPPENIDEMARVARSTSIPICTGERLSTVYELAQLLEKQAASILNMALSRCGGILEAKIIAGVAKAHYAQIVPHWWAGPIEGAANVQLDTCSPNFLIQGVTEKWRGFFDKILKKSIRWEDGYIMIPTEPGLGIELNEEVLAQYPCNEVPPGA